MSDIQCSEALKKKQGEALGLRELASVSGAYCVRNRRKAASRVQLSSRSEVTAEEQKGAGAIDQRHCENLVQTPAESFLLDYWLHTHTNTHTHAQTHTHTWTQVYLIITTAGP